MENRLNSKSTYSVIRYSVIPYSAFYKFPVLNSKNNYNYQVKVWVWCGVGKMNGRTVYVFTAMLTNRLHGKAAELCLANS